MPETLHNPASVRPSALVLTRRSQLRQRIARYIQAHPGCTGNQLQAAIGGNRRNQFEAVRDLKTAGVIIGHRSPADRRVILYTLAASYQPEPEPPKPPPPRRETCAHCHRPLPPRKHRFCSDLCRIRQWRKEGVTENSDYADWTARQITRLGIRAADPGDLADIASLANRVREALTTAVGRCRAQGFSDADIGTALGITRQAVWKRFGRQPEVDTSEGSDPA